MVMQIISELGPWTWIILGLVMLVLEVLAPGIFFLWLGLAAIVVGAVSLAAWGPGAAIWTWQVQVIAFVVLSVVLAYLGRKWLMRRDGPSDEPLLNDRIGQLVGRTATLDQPIVNGVGRVRLGDTLWRVKGPDMPAGATVRVLGGNSDRLEVESV